MGKGVRVWAVQRKVLRNVALPGTLGLSLSAEV